VPLAATPGFAEVVEVDALGTGCILIHRRVLTDPGDAPAFDQLENQHGVVTVGEDV
jgi:hypothetical protein